MRLTRKGWRAAPCAIGPRRRLARTFGRTRAVALGRPISRTIPGRLDRAAARRRDGWECHPTCVAGAERRQPRCAFRGARATMSRRPASGRAATHLPVLPSSARRQSRLARCPWACSRPMPGPRGSVAGEPPPPGARGRATDDTQGDEGGLDAPPRRSAGVRPTTSRRRPSGRAPTRLVVLSSDTATKHAAHVARERAADQRPGASSRGVAGRPARRSCGRAADDASAPCPRAWADAPRGPAPSRQLKKGRAPPIP
jgi:hypothetical protein